MEYTPDKWSVFWTGQCYKVFGSWAGGYLDGDYWRANSGITKVEREGDVYLFHGYSGSIYECHVKGYGVATFWSRGILQNILDGVPEAVSFSTEFDEDTDWTTFDYTVAP